MLTPSSSNTHGAGILNKTKVTEACSPSFRKSQVSIPLLRWMKYTANIGRAFPSGLAESAFYLFFIVTLNLPTHEL